MNFKQYMESIKDVPVSDNLQYHLAVFWLHLRCYEKTHNPQPTDIERKAFRELLDEISSTTPIDTNASLAATETKNCLLDVTMIDSQQKEYGLLMNWCEVLNLHISQELTDRFGIN